MQTSDVTDVPGTKIGRQWRIRRRDLDQVLGNGVRAEYDQNGAARAEVGADGSSG